MDFFGRQDHARRLTTRLVLLYVAAIVAIIIAVYLVATFAFGLSGEGEPGLWRPDVLAITAGAVLVVVGLGTLYKVAQLRTGGAAVASMLGGRRVQANTEDRLEKRLVNVVEEMAISAGMPVPDVFVLDREQGINAFAAGFSPDDAAVAVTRGGLEQLDRDQLQGVIAHEFSHVFHGDMRLNIRLMGTLHGITCLAMGGYLLLRSGVFAGGGRNRNGAPILILALGLIVIGFTGVLFARIIKAAVSRQREFLADAAAVQFTRNPAGISGALRRIGGFEQGGKLRNGHTEEAAHMLFSDGLGRRLFATHPPLAERIARIDRGFDPETAPRAAAAPAAAPGEGAAAAAGFAGAGDGAPVRATPEELVQRIGAPAPEDVDHARQLLAAIPAPLHAAAHQPFSARALVLALLLETGRDLRRTQLHTVADRLGAPVAQEALTLSGHLRELPAAARLPLVELALPALRHASEEQVAAYLGTLELLATADDGLSPFELALLEIVGKHLGPRPRGRSPRSERPSAFRAECGRLLSVLAHAGHDDEEEAARALAGGAEILGIPLELGTEGTSALRAVRADLQRLARSRPRLRRLLLLAAARVVATDEVLNTGEGELLRAFAAVLDCPMPPLGTLRPAS